MQEDIVEPVVQQSVLMWYYSSLGLKYALALPAAGLFSFVAALLILIRGRGPFLGSGLVLAVSAPVFVGLVGTVDGVMAVYQIIGMSSSTPRASDLGHGVSMALVAMQVGLVCAFPSLALATVGSLIRSMTATEPSGSDATLAYSPQLPTRSPAMK
jgi:hypothetical protein